MTVVTLATMALILGILWYRGLPSRKREERPLPDPAWLQGQSYAGTVRYPAPFQGASLCEATHAGHLASPPLVSAGGSRWREAFRSHLGMTDPVPSSASPRLNNGWVPQCFGHSTARQLGRGSHHLGSRKVPSVAVYGVPLRGEKEALRYATRLCRRCHPASAYALPARPSPAAAFSASGRGAAPVSVHHYVNQCEVRGRGDAAAPQD